MKPLPIAILLAGATLLVGCQTMTNKNHSSRPPVKLGDEAVNVHPFYLVQTQMPQVFFPAVNGIRLRLQGRSSFGILGLPVEIKIADRKGGEVGSLLQHRQTAFAPVHQQLIELLFGLGGRQRPFQRHAADLFAGRCAGSSTVIWA